jgi:hypothetical protein
MTTKTAAIPAEMMQTLRNSIKNAQKRCDCCEREVSKTERIGTYALCSPCAKAERGE